VKDLIKGDFVEIAGNKEGKVLFGFLKKNKSQYLGGNRSPEKGRGGGGKVSKGGKFFGLRQVQNGKTKRITGYPAPRIGKKRVTGHVCRVR